MKKFLLLLAVLVIIAGSISTFILFRRMENEEQAELADVAGKVVSVSETPTVTNTKKELPRVTNILLIGVDNDYQAGMDELGNSDGLMLVSVNTETEELIITSFLRDTRVRVNDAYYDKLTMVYHTGGTELLEKTFEDNFGIHVDYYAQFNYLDIVDIVDSIGGVEVELSAEEIYFMEGKIKNLSSLTNTSYSDNKLTTDQAGHISLNGVQASAYMRIRPAEGNYDFGRTERGRNVVAEIMKKLYSMRLQDMLQFADALFSKIENDIPADLMLRFAADAEGIKTYKQIMDRIPVDNAYTSLNDGSGSYIVPDFEINNKHLYESIYEGKR